MRLELTDTKTLPATFHVYPNRQDNGAIDSRSDSD